MVIYQQGNIFFQLKFTSLFKAITYRLLTFCACLLLLIMPVELICQETPATIPDSTVLKPNNRFGKRTNAPKDSSQLDAASTTATNDTLLIIDSLNAAMTQKIPDTSIKASKAILWGLAPGLGQWYNKQYWKTPFFAGGFATLATFTAKYRLDYRRNYRLQTEILNNYANGILDTRDIGLVQRNKAVANRNYRWFLTSTVIFYTANVVDAYLSATILNDRHKHSPIKASYYAILFPGLGQAYNRSYWKIPFVWAGFGFIGYVIYFNVDQFKRLQNEYLYRTRPGFVSLTTHPDPALSGFTDASLLAQRNQHRRNLEIAVLVGTLWYAITILDATIDAHLKDFDVSDDLSLNIQPFVAPINNNQIGFASNSNFVGGLNMSIRF